MKRHAILVLGMHRSGTSALTRLLGTLGAALPSDAMPATADNPNGYWESQTIARFNNRLLESAGTRWNDDTAVPPGWFNDSARAHDREEARCLFNDSFASAPLLVFKDPRLCRLLPFWRQVLCELGIEQTAVLMMRDPLEVAQSLATRCHTPEFRPAAIPDTSRALLLWLRYVLDAERHSRGMSRVAIDYFQLVADWRAALNPLAALLPIDFPEPGSTCEESVAAVVDARLHRHRVAAVPIDGSRTSGIHRLRGLHALLVDCGAKSNLRTTFECDALSIALDRFVANYAPLRRIADPLVACDNWSRTILDQLAGLGATSLTQRPKRILFLSGAPSSIGHVYRVSHPVSALASRGWQASWLPIEDDAVPARLEHADIVVVFRARYSAIFDVVRSKCHARSVPLVFDVDDLIFDPKIMEAGCFAYLDDLQASDRQQWLDDAASWFRALAASDAAVLSTPQLAVAAARHCAQVKVLPNCLDPILSGLANAARQAPKPSATDGRPRFGFASGTPTHRRDFAVAASALAALFDRRPEPVLVVVGALDMSAYPDLTRHAHRIEVRPSVPLHNLFGEISRFDFNLAPLELGNPFCEAKSAVRCLAASAVGVPTVATPTAPLRDSILPGLTGLLATDVGDWESALELLIDDPSICHEMGEAARIHAQARFGPEAYADMAECTFSALLPTLVG